MTQHPPEGQEGGPVYSFAMLQREMVELQRVCDALRLQAEQDKKRIAEGEAWHRAALEAGRWREVERERAEKVEKRVNELTIGFDQDKDTIRRLEASLAAKEAELAEAVAELETDGETISKMEKIFKDQAATIAGYADAMKRIKAEAYGEKSWAFVVDQIAQIEIKSPSDFAKEHDAVEAVVEAAKVANMAFMIPILDKGRAYSSNTALGEALARLSELRGGK